MRFTLYSRQSCHLCEEMLIALRNALSDKLIEVEVVDIDQSPDLAVKYGLYVPVLTSEGEEICHYHLDTQKLASYLAKKD